MNLFDGRLYGPYKNEDALIRRIEEIVQTIDTPFTATARVLGARHAIETRDRSGYFVSATLLKESNT